MLLSYYRRFNLPIYVLKLCKTKRGAAHRRNLNACSPSSFADRVRRKNIGGIAGTTPASGALASINRAILTRSLLVTGQRDKCDATCSRVSTR